MPLTVRVTEPAPRRRMPAAVVRTLIADQFPHWSHLPVHEVERPGNDNHTFRLGDAMSVRLPTDTGYVAAVAKESRALPLLAGHLPVPIPRVLGTGRPGPGFPRPWSVRDWLDGESLDTATVDDDDRVAQALGSFLQALRRAPAADGPAAGRHSFFRGCHPGVYDGEVSDALDRLGGAVDRSACRAIWRRALASAWTGPPVWFHGDVAAGNLLVRDGSLAAVIDFGTCGVGDPACDLVIAWTWCGPASRRVFADAVDLDAGTWDRARGWALWKSLVTLTGPDSPDTVVHRTALRRLLTEI